MDQHIDVDGRPQLGVLEEEDLAGLGAEEDVPGAHPVVAEHLVVLALGVAELLEHALGEAAEAEEARADDADDVVVLRVEGDLRDGRPGGRQVTQGRDHLLRGNYGLREVCFFRRQSCFRIFISKLQLCFDSIQCEIPIGSKKVFLLKTGTVGRIC